MIASAIHALSAQTSLAVAGGKGLNLTRLYRAGFPVPPGFIICTTAYQSFVAKHGLSALILDTMARTDLGDPGMLEAAAQTIRARFAAAKIPADLATKIRATYADLGRPPVAVRSSATAEDLPGHSFAGQQDTYLNIIGEDTLLEAIIGCWGSLWTARAIGYRARIGIAPRDLALAVVVQTMVPSEASGVLFTANPLTGNRTEMVIDATFGLGEALVSGQVEPDHYVVTSDGRIQSKSLGSKSAVVRGQASGGTVTLERHAASQQAVPDAMILQLAHLGQRIAELFGTPQDIEWATMNEQLYILQSRPITTLYPMPDGISREPLRALFSFGAVQGMLDPMTPLGRDTITAVLIGTGRIVGSSTTVETQRVLWEAGERLWIDATGMVNNRLGRRAIDAAMEYVVPGARQALATLTAQGRFPEPNPLSSRTALRLLMALLPAVGRMVRTLLRPDAERDKTVQFFDAQISEFETRLAGASCLSERLALIRRSMDRIFGILLPHFVPRFGLGMAAYTLLTRLAATLPDGTIDTRMMMRGVPHNVTTEMDLTLWRSAQTIRADAPSVAHMRDADPATLADDYTREQLPTVAQAAISAFMERYGMRGLGEIDLGRPRWRSDPAPIMQTLQSYLKIDDPDLAPDVVYERGRHAAMAEIERLLAALANTRGGWIKVLLARTAAERMRALMGLRETPKFVVIRILGLMQSALLVDGAQLMAEGMLSRPDDVFYLHMRELETLVRGERRDWVTMVQTRRQAAAREQLRRQIPRLLLSTGEAFYGGAADTGDENVLIGSPVSPGVVEGAVRIVLDPRRTQLTPGEILVCPGTDPSWTPLFLVAGGLVMEVGGMMTHGAVVAREYGIPAVVSVHQATQRLHTGQRVRVDGSTGLVTMVRRHE
jgi:rifampicin phosphotransferase